MANIKTLAEVLNEQYQELLKAFGGCEYCYGKGYSTNIDKWSGSDEYTGEKYEGLTDYYLPCDRCDRGKQIEIMITTLKGK